MKQKENAGKGKRNKNKTLNTGEKTMKKEKQAKTEEKQQVIREPDVQFYVESIWDKLTGNRQQAYLNNFEVVYDKLQDKFKYVEAAFCPISKQLDDIDKLARDTLLLKYSNSILDEFVSTLEPPFDVDDERFGSPTIDELMDIAERVEAKFGMTLTEAKQFLDSYQSTIVKARNLFRTFQGTLHGSYLEYARKSVHNARLYSKIDAKIV